MFMSVFELVMLLCFGTAWPFSIHKSIVSHSVKGKSLAFLLIVWIGYLAGVLHKVFYHPDVVVIFYAINLTMVSVDTVLYLRNRRILNSKQQFKRSIL
jgi:hypothetical protein